MSFCPDLFEVITLGGRTGTVVDLIGNPCVAFIVEFGDGDLQTFDQFGVPAPSEGES